MKAIFIHKIHIFMKFIFIYKIHILMNVKFIYKIHIFMNSYFKFFLFQHGASGCRSVSHLRDQLKIVWRNCNPPHLKNKNFYSWRNYKPPQPKIIKKNLYFYIWPLIDTCGGEKKI